MTDHIEVLQQILDGTPSDTLHEDHRRALDAAITALSARASAGEGWPVLWVSRDALQQATACANADRPTVATVNAWNDPQRLAGHDPVALYTAAPQPAQAGASGGGEIPVCPRCRKALPPRRGVGRTLFSTPCTDCMEWKSPHRTTPASPATGEEDSPQDISWWVRRLKVQEAITDKYVARVAELESSQPAAAQGGEWLPIESAPSGGLVLLAVQAYENPSERRAYAAEQSHGADGSHWVITTGWTGWTRLHGAWEPIGWKPLPDAKTLAAAPQPQNHDCDMQCRYFGLHKSHGSLTPPAHGDGEGELTAEQCAEWLEAKYHRHGEDEDRQAAAMIRRLTTRPTPEAQEAREYRLFDSQWVNVVNHAGCYRDMNKEDAVAQAVKLTEQAMAANINDCKWPRPRKADAALALPAQGEGKNG